MELAATTLIVGSGLVHAIVNAIFKAGRDKMSGRALIDGFSALLIAPAALLVPLPHGAWGWLALSWALHTAYIYTLIKSFEQSDMTVAYPIARGVAPVLAASAAAVRNGHGGPPHGSGQLHRSGRRMGRGRHQLVGAQSLAG